jgi:hypothetical protein
MYRPSGGLSIDGDDDRGGSLRRATPASRFSITREIATGRGFFSILNFTLDTTLAGNVYESFHESDATTGAGSAKQRCDEKNERTGV